MNWGGNIFGGPRKLIVGVDFGTTFSGVAWAETKRPDVLSTITTWPVSSGSLEGASSEKVPSKLRYSATGTQWGFSIPLNASTATDVVEWWKLDLEPSMDRLQQSKDNCAARGGRDAVQLTRDYLGLLSDHLLYVLRQKLGESVASSTPLEFVITVPAIWSDAAKDTTRRALLATPALRASDTVIHLVSEPEAAAIYSLAKLNTHGLHSGDGVVVVDAGGGTVDLISYILTRLDPTLEVEEAASGSGGLCGSTFLNNRFETFLRSKLGNEEGFDHELIAEAMDVFETKVRHEKSSKSTLFTNLCQIKRLFSAATPLEEKFMIPVGGLANNAALGVARGRFSLTTSDLINIFKPVVDEVVQLVQEQIKAASSKARVKAVLLVGGFGASVYLREKLQESLGSNIKVLQPPHAWQAVVNGAVLKGLALNDAGTPEVSVVSRQARHSYGLDLSSLYEDGAHRHLQHHKYYCERKGKYRVKVMNWFVGRVSHTRSLKFNLVSNVTKGDKLSEDKPIPIKIVQYNIPVKNNRPTICNVCVFYDKSKRQPSRAAMSRDNQITQVATLLADLSTIPKSRFDRYQGADNRWYYSIDFTVEAIFQSASIAFSLWHKGETPIQTAFQVIDS